MLVLNKLTDTCVDGQAQCDLLISYCLVLPLFQLIDCSAFSHIHTILFLLFIVLLLGQGIMYVCALSWMPFLLQWDQVGWSCYFALHIHQIFWFNFQAGSMWLQTYKRRCQKMLYVRFWQIRELSLSFTCFPSNSNYNLIIVLFRVFWVNSYL